MWSIWKEQNMRIFEQKFSSIDEIHNLILLRIRWWIKGWGDPFPYSSTDILRNPSCLQWQDNISMTCLSRAKVSSPRSWSPPPTNVLKWNVDASGKEDKRKAAIGGVLRNSNGNFLCLFSSPIPIMDINNAEILAIHRAIKLPKSCDRISYTKLIIESDSANAVKWCNEINGGPSNLNFITNYIRAAMKDGDGVEIIYKSRKTNFVADSMAKQGLNKADEFVAWL